MLQVFIKGGIFIKDDNEVFRFLSESEIKNIIEKINDMPDSDEKVRFYLVTLGYRSIDVQNYTLVEAQQMIEDSNVPYHIRECIKKSYNSRIASIEANNLKSEDDNYLFVTKELKHIHDSILLRDWRKFLKDNDLDDINIQVFRQSINHLNTMDRYYKELIKEVGVEK